MTSGWEAVPFWSIAHRVERTGYPDAQLLSVYRDWGVVRKADRDDNPNKASEDLSTYKYVEPGDLVLNKMKTWQGSLGVSQYEGIVSPAYFVCSVSPAVHGRFLHHLLRSRKYIAMYEANSKGIRTNQWDLPYEVLRQIPILKPDLDKQRQIADFLDDRVARIDQIIAARRRQVMLTLEAGAVETSNILGAVVPEGPPLSAVCRIVDTEHKTAPTVPEGGYWIAGTGAIKAGRLVLDRLRETDLGSFLEWTARGAPVTGDVLLTREAPVGEVALLTDGDPAVAIGQRVVLLKPNRSVLDAGFLRLVLMAGEMRSIIALASAGSLHPHLNMSDISRLRLPDLRLEEQRTLGLVHQRILENTATRASELERSVGLLSEYKQSLITAAVTGEIDVTTAGSG